MNSNSNIPTESGERGGKVAVGLVAAGLVLTVWLAMKPDQMSADNYQATHPDNNQTAHEPKERSLTARKTFDQPSANKTDTTHPDARRAADEPKWRSLFNGKTLDGWAITDFGGQGDVLVDDGNLVLEMGSDLTGVTATQDIPRGSYEVRLEAMRAAGSDFFCGLTFPVGKAPCTLIIGGWGGGVCGLSSIDGMDASENEVHTYREFETNRWYGIRLRVTKQKIEAWIDDEQIVDFEHTGRKLSIRSEVDLSVPFGFASWQTTAVLKDIQLLEIVD